MHVFLSYFVILTSLIGVASCIGQEVLYCFDFGGAFHVLGPYPQCPCHCRLLPWAYNRSYSRSGPRAGPRHARGYAHQAEAEPIHVDAPVSSHGAGSSSPA